MATAQTWVDQIAITPHVSEERASFALTLGGTPVTAASLEVTVGRYHAAAKVIDGNRAAVDLPMPNAKLWTPDSPDQFTSKMR